MSHSFSDANFSDAKVTVGIDLGDRTSQIYEVDASGTRRTERSIATIPQALHVYFADRSPCRVVLEAGTHSPWVTRELQRLGHEVIVSNPTKTYGPRRRRRKNDPLDAEFLARQGRADVRLLHPITHRSATAQQHLTILRARDQLVKTRTQLINHVRGAVKPMGARLARCSAEAFARRAAPAIPSELQPALQPLLDLVAELTQRIRAADRQIQALAALYPAATHLQQPAGVGPLTATAFVLLLDDPTRFRNSRDVGAYFGLVPRLEESGDARPQLRISKAGDALGRRLLITAAQYILGPFGPPCDLRRHGEAIAARGGKTAKKRAVVAVARKLAVLLHHLWISNEAYDPDYNLTRRSA